MADILPDLLTAYQVSLAANMVTGQSLDWAAYASTPGETEMTEWWNLFPLILYAPTNTTLEPDSMEGSCRSDKKVYTITFNIILDAYDPTAGTRIVKLPDVVTAMQREQTMEALYNRNTLGMSQGCLLTSVTYGSPTLAGLNVDKRGWIYSVNMNFDHLWQDRRYT